MKKIIFTLLFISFGFIGYTQSWRNSNILTGTEDVNVLSTATDSEKNTIVFGHFQGTLNPPGKAPLNSYGGRDYFLAKFDSLSVLTWINRIGGSLNEFFEGSACVCQDDNILVTGSFQNYLKYTPTDSIQSIGFHDIFLAKYDPDGGNLWCLNVGSGNNYQRSNAIKGDFSGNILVSGYFADSININNDTTLFTDNAYKDYYLSKHDGATGEVIWAKSFKSINTNRSGFIYSIIPAADHYVLTGVFSDSIDIGIDTLVSETADLYDVHIIKTDLEGNISWVRKIQGNAHDYSYTGLMDPTNNIYVTGYYNSTLGLTIDSTETETVFRDQNNGSYDFFVAKYTTDGTLQWINLNGGAAEDRLLRSEFFNDEINVTGYFADVLNWGGTQLATNGTLDRDMFYGSIDLDGNYRNANKFNGRSNSSEEGRALFSDGENLYTALRSNSDLLVLGDSIYTSATGKYNVVVGVIGCLPIDLTVDVSDASCYGDSSGSIIVTAEGGFGGPYKFSEDNGLSYKSKGTFENLPAGTYNVVVKDQENCAQAYSNNPVLIGQPDPFVYTDINLTDATFYGEDDGSISVTVGGGTAPYTYTLDGGAPQAIGNFTSLTAGTYLVEVNDFNSCGPIDTTLSLLQPLFTVSVDSTFNVTTQGGSDGEIYVSVVETGTFEFSIDSAISFQASGAFTGLAPGDYYVYVRDDADTVAYASNPVQISEPSSVSGKLQDQLRIYPNPSNGTFTLEFSQLDKETRVEVYSMSGTRVYLNEFPAHAGNFKETLNLRSFGKGIYLLKLNGEAVATRLVVQ